MVAVGMCPFGVQLSIQVNEVWRWLSAWLSGSVGFAMPILPLGLSFRNSACFHEWKPVQASQTAP